MRSALLLSVLSCMMSMLFSAAMGLGGAGMPPFARLTLEAMVTVIAFGMTAYLGLCVLDGDQRKMLPLFTLTRGQIFWLALLGALLTAPLTLMGDVLEALFAGTQTLSGAAGQPFLLQLLKSALLVPVCEELFFRGYLYHALARVSKRRAAAVSALVFALAHGLSVYGFLPRLVLGLLLCALMERTGTLLSSMLVHGCYNAAIVLAACSGAAPLFSGLTLAGCALRLALCLFGAYALRRAWTARGIKKPVQPMASLRFTKRESLLIAAALLLAVMAEVLS